MKLRRELGMLRLVSCNSLNDRVNYGFHDLGHNQRGDPRRGYGDRNRKNQREPVTLREFTD